MQPKELFINSVRQIRVQGHAVVPTVVLYKDRKSIVGFEAIDQCDHPANLREDFKVELGNDHPLKLAQQRTGLERSPIGIAKDFIDAVVSQGLSSVERQGFTRPTRILIAEPLSLAQDRVAHEEWLSNYRNSIRRILTGKFAEIDFLPEPFAVFQYYRYGVRHALVAQKQKHVALVLDFGGGTFDASVVETTAMGDISQSGRNSKPLAARSIPIGGFAINRMIGEALLFRVLDKSVDKPSVRKALNAFADLKNLDDEALALHRSDHAAFTRNYRRFLRSVEQAKVVVCSGITNWRLDANLASSPTCPVEVPQRPLQNESPLVSVGLEANEIRTIYESRAWKQELLPAIKETLKRAEVELGGKPISIVLLSGGSSNIRWLKYLIERDLSEQLRGADILELSENFQEIVAKGLAVECARRFYTEGQGDFRAVTYNRLCLALKPNANGLELKRYIPESSELEGIESDPGVLLPSATILRGLIGRPLHWKVRLSKPPTQLLDYYFMRSSFNPEEASARHNLESRVVTPRGTAFGGSIGIELTVREDGTTEPAFIYGHGSQGDRSTKVTGRPFYMDMTFAGEEAVGETYLGFDFGTSTSSLCYVDANDIRAYADRARDRTWLSLSTLTNVLPYPAAYPLARFLSETSNDHMERWGREALEGMLALVAYIAYVEHCTLGGAAGGFFKGFRQRSAGPLWAMFKNCVAATGHKWQLGKELLALSAAPTFEEIDKSVSQVALAKHGKRVEHLDYPRVLEKIGNALARAMQGKVLGYFEDARRKPFSMKTFQGVFRNAQGASPPFIDIYEYEGTEDFPSEFVFLFDVETGTGIPLFPLVVRAIDRARSHYEEPDFFLYDIVRREEIAYKAVQERDEVVTSSSGPLSELFGAAETLLKSDPAVDAVTGVALRSRPRD